MELSFKQPLEANSQASAKRFWDQSATSSLGIGLKITAQVLHICLPALDCSCIIIQIIREDRETCRQTLLWWSLFIASLGIQYAKHTHLKIIK